MERTSITAILLAGGQGSRMNHRDKAWATHKGRPLIRHVLERVEPHVFHVIISRNRDNPAYADLPYPAYSDDLPDFQGPLAGITSCLPHVETSLTLVIPCDTPNLPVNLVPRLLEALGDRSLAVAEENGRLQQLVFLAKTEVLGSIEDYLLTGKRSVMGWLERQDIAAVGFDNEFENINRTSQLR